ncbi:unnamed protein product [Dovyalis caffra]|uniref:BHLH domain-containing protein n=1 Tax=Dovyalis caffra TaxID=77055 RepID=A0AAV1S6D7_9ROSI|nr:unnamed protein product [Dovyalis caffra]
MDIIDNISEYQNYWDTIRFWNEELNFSWATNDQQLNLEYYDSSSPDGTASTMLAPKNTVSERNRRKKLNDKLLALREAVPRISKMDKPSIIKDAIEYIQDLQEQEKRLQAEITELESQRLMKDPGYDYEPELSVLLRSKRTRHDQIWDRRLARSCPIEVHELSITYMGENTLFVSLTCKKTTDTMIRICEVFESLKLKIIATNLTTLSGMVKNTVLIKVDEEEKEHMKIKIERELFQLLDPHTVP